VPIANRPELKPDLGQIQEAPADAPIEADSRTKEEEADWDRRAKTEQLAEFILLRRLRETFCNRIFWLVVWWLCAVFFLIILDGSLAPWHLFSIPSAVLIALISGTTINLIGVLIVVMRYLFPIGGPAAFWRGRREPE
jgi:hypothetical protein